MPARNFEYRYRGPRNTPEERGGKPPSYSRTVENEHAMIIERDLAVPLRDGTKVYVNIYRPADERPVPPIIAWSPYGKHVPFDPRRFLNAGVKEGDGARGSAGFLRLGRMGGHATVEQREGRAVGRVLSGAAAVARGRAQSAASRRHQPVGRLDRQLPRGRDPRWHSGYSFLGL